jgi:hypothetical protein
MALMGAGAGITRGYALAAGRGLPQHPDDPGIKASAASTGGALTLIESRLSSGPPRHVRESAARDRPLQRADESRPQTESSPTRRDPSEPNNADDRSNA